MRIAEPLLGYIISNAMRKQLVSASLGVIAVAIFATRGCPEDRRSEKKAGRGGTFVEGDPFGEGVSLDSSKPAKLPREPEPQGGAHWAQKYLQSIIIPRIAFEDTSLEEAIEFIRQRVRELDTKSPPERRGMMSVVVQEPRTTVPQAENGEPEVDGPAELGGDGSPPLRIKELYLENVSVWDAMRRIAAETGMKVEITDFAIVFSPLE